MICADFFRNEHDRLVGFRITGHAGYADYGEDVCCASVSSAVMLTANTVTEAFKIKADVAVEENEIILRRCNWHLRAVQDSRKIYWIGRRH